MNEYVTVNGRKFRKGYTTGSCAAAAAKAAVMMLYSGTAISAVIIDTPAEVRLTLPVTDTVISGENVVCSVIKDGGDDPDITTGLKIFAEARRKNEPGIEITTGEGIGKVTLPGLKVEVGKPAINPVPLKMILKEVGEVLKENDGISIRLSVPGGAEIAKKTYNPRLGIVGGISILGTSGIVNPMSEEAWKEALALELGVLAAKGEKTAVFVFGNYGEKFAEDILKLDNKNTVKISNFMGFMLDKAAEYEFEQVLVIGHLGKLVKVAAGIFHTHSRVADARMETMSAFAALEGASKDVIEQIFESRTTEAAADILKSSGLSGVYKRIVNNASKRCTDYVFEKLKVGSVLFHEDNTILALDDAAGQILKELGSAYGG